jgi:hypothetical protein
MKHASHLRRSACALAMLGVIGACSGPYTTIAPRIPDSAELGARTSGSACGLVLLNIIPIGINDRAERAYRNALEPTKANELGDVSVVDSWYYILIGEILCAEVSGAVVVPRSAPNQPPGTIMPAPSYGTPPPTPRAAPPQTPPTSNAPTALPGSTARRSMPPEVVAKTTLLEKLRELKRLHDAGVLNDTDYGAFRSEVIDTFGPDAGAR